MANEDHLKILTQGVKAWNQWRDENRGIRMADLSGANLSKTDLSRANLSWADLSRVDFSGAGLSEVEFRGGNLSWAKLSRADLSRGDLSRTNLSGANLGEADLSEANLSGTNLSGANLSEANLSSANLSNANLSEANLRLTNLSGANLSEADLRRTILTDSEMHHTILGEVDLSQARGLDTVQHLGPSIIGIDTIYLSQGKIPAIFLRRAGVPEPFIVNMKSLVAAMSPIDFYSCFISYSSKDQEFAERLYADLQAKGVRCWYAHEDLKIGDKFRQRIDDAIRVHDKVLVVLSETSVNSSWVEKEVEAAFEKERASENRTVLFPIRLDQAVMKTSQAWAADIRRMRHMGDFSQWHNHNSYKNAFGRLLRDLQGQKRKDSKVVTAP